ncbi:oligosaccharide flippase family protein [uncultured Alistipes sp.]|uniref:oligosaccharide flippase family protein n=1 Tax=uncultured Alistipes sp. TaxID=538949 RepID=UPI002630E003|nr:oligosaccharide flippase family protein [uncultured Alistipes sp.]
MANSPAVKSGLAVNTFMLYVLTFSNYLFAFMTVPYQTRVLGPEIYGLLGFAFATMVYFQLVMDFGFMLSATAEIAEAKGDRRKIAQICEAVSIGKMLLALPCAGVLLVLCSAVPQFAADSTVFWFCLLYTIINSLIPDYLYRGMEQMAPITYRTLLVKLIFTIGVFVFVKAPGDYVLVPVFYLLGAVVAVGISFCDARKRFGLTVVRVTRRDVFSRIAASSPFFVSRIASTAYGATNTMILGLLYPGQSLLGHYTSAEKVVSLVRTGASPISDSLYPYLIRSRNFGPVWRILSLAMPAVVAGAALLWVYAPQICAFVFGAEYEAAALPLRCLMPVIVFVLPSYVFGFPLMTPLGIARYANLSVVLGAVVQLVLLAGLYLASMLTLASVCVATSITETFVLVFRVVVVCIYLKKHKV